MLKYVDVATQNGLAYAMTSRLSFLSGAMSAWWSARLPYVTDTTVGKVVTMGSVSAWMALAVTLVCIIKNMIINCKDCLYVKYCGSFCGLNFLARPSIKIFAGGICCNLQCKGLDNIPWILLTLKIEWIVSIHGSITSVLMTMDDHFFKNSKIYCELRTCSFTYLEKFLIF